MTCIAGLVRDGRVYIGGDSAAVAGSTLFVRGDPKVFLNGEFIMGFSHSFRMGQILRYGFTPPKVDGADLDFYMVTRFVNELRRTLNSHGQAKTENGQENA